MTRIYSQKGFTLIEIIVAVAIFTVVMLIAIGAVLNAVDVNKKAQSLNVIANNLNLAVESMVRDLRTGSGYELCQSGVEGACVSFRNKDGANVRYSMGGNAGAGYLIKNAPAAVVSGEGRITSEEVRLEHLAFTIRGGGSNDGPERILVHISGSAGSGRTASDFNIETVVTSRTLDINELNP
jgi:prepilin-type N-terminal cleavage/methylation domain-containing protein